MTDYKFHSSRINGVRKLKYGYDTYLRDITTLYQNIKNSGKEYDIIIGVQRGGLIPAVHLSNLLDVPMQALQWSHTKGKVREGSSPHLICNRDKNVLLVDDILDVGNTIHEIHNHYWKMDTAVLIHNVENKFNITPDFAAWVINRSELPDWIDYWWEKETNNE